MVDKSTKFTAIAVMTLLSFLIAAPQSGQAQSASKSLSILDKEVETKALQETTEKPIKLKDALDHLVSEIKKQNGNLAIILDVDAFHFDNPDAPDVRSTPISFSVLPEKMGVGTLLRLCLNKIATKNATFIAMPDHILITTHSAASPENRLNQLVWGVFEKRPMANIARELADKVGMTISIDPRAAEKAKTEVSITLLNNVSLAGALRTLTEMADLKVLMLDGALLITIPEHAEKVRREEREKSVPTLPPIPAPSTPGSFPGVPSSGIPDYMGPTIDPLWPFIPMSYRSWRYYKFD